MSLARRRRHQITTLFLSGGATLHQKVVVTGVGDIWRARGAQAYKVGLGAEPPAGSRGRAPGGGQEPPEAERFWQNNRTSKSVHNFSTFTTYMQGLVSYFADKNECDSFAREKVVVACHHRHIQSCAYASCHLLLSLTWTCITDGIAPDCTISARLKVTAKQGKFRSTQLKFSTAA